MVRSPELPARTSVFRQVPGSPDFRTLVWRFSHRQRSYLRRLTSGSETIIRWERNRTRSSEALDSFSERPRNSSLRNMTHDELDRLDGAGCSRHVGRLGTCSSISFPG